MEFPGSWMKTPQDFHCSGVTGHKADSGTEIISFPRLWSWMTAFGSNPRLLQMMKTSLHAYVENSANMDAIGKIQRAYAEKILSSMLCLKSKDWHHQYRLQPTPLNENHRVVQNLFQDTDIIFSGSFFFFSNKRFIHLCFLSYIGSKKVITPLYAYLQRFFK